MDRFDFQRLAKLRLQDAEALLDDEKWSGAYYICGYAVECALKACIAKQTRQYDFPDKKTVNDSCTHDLAKLVELAGLEQKRQEASKNSEKFGIYWSNIKDWSELSRYELRPDEQARKRAEDLHEAVTDEKNGVMQWLQMYW